MYRLGSPKGKSPLYQYLHIYWHFIFIIVIFATLFQLSFRKPLLLVKPIPPYILNLSDYFFLFLLYSGWTLLWGQYFLCILSILSWDYLLFIPFLQIYMSFEAHYLARKNHNHFLSLLPSSSLHSWKSLVCGSVFIVLNSRCGYWPI